MNDQDVPSLPLSRSSSSISTAHGPQPSRGGDEESNPHGGHAHAQPYDIGPAPDGGRTAWLVVFASFFQQFCIFGLLSSNGQLQAYYRGHQLAAYSKSDIAWFGSIQTLLEFGAAMITGRYFDVHGPRLLVSCCLLMSFVAIIGLAFSHEYYQFMLSFVLFGIAATLIYAPSAAVASHWFEARRGLAVGIIVCGSGIGGVIYPVMLEQIMKHLSYRDTMLIIGGFNFILMVPGFFFMKSRLPPRTPPPWSDLKGPWREPQYCFHVAGAAMFGMNLLTPSFQAIEYARSNNCPPSITQYAVAISLGASVMGRIGFGMLADRIGVWRVYGCIGFMAAIVMFAFWTPPVGTVATVFGLALFGIMSGGWFVLVPAATAAISPLHEAGMRFGMLITSIAIPSLVGPVISAALSGSHFRNGAIFCGVTYFVSGILTNFVPLSKWVKARRGVQEDKTRASSVEVPSAAEDEKTRAAYVEQ